MGVGAVIYAVDGSTIKKDDAVFKHSTFIPADQKNSNNVAEYLAFKSILEWLAKNFDNKKHSARIQIWGDSKLVIMQMTGVWKMKAGYYIPIANESRQILKQLERWGLSFQIAWHGRELNAYADELSKAELIKNKIEFKIQPQ